VRQHHERLDGSGYPSGMKDEEILPAAKILAVADVVEAMASHRPYRPALSIGEALAEIEKNRGARYEPEAVDACLRLCASAYSLHHRLRETGHRECLQEAAAGTRRA